MSIQSLFPPEIRLPSSRAEAKAVGSSRYFTGLPCKHGHVSPRLTSGGNCIACWNAWQKDNRDKVTGYKRSWEAANPEKRDACTRRWQRNNPDRVRAAQLKFKRANVEALNKTRREFYAQNPEIGRKKSRLFREENREKANASARKWAAANVEKVRAFTRNRRARKQAAEGKHTPDDIAALRAKQRDRCAACGTNLMGKGHVDHIVALSRGGSNWPSNLQLLCASCNASKGAKDYAEFLKLRGDDLRASSSSGCHVTEP